MEASDIGESGPEQEAVESLVAAWSRVSVKLRPTDPVRLAEIIADRVAWPGDGYDHSPEGERALARHLDERLDHLLNEARRLRNALPQNSGSYHLERVMGDRAPHDADIAVLTDFEMLLPRLAQLQLRPRPKDKGGRPVPDRFAKVVVRVVFWYLLRCEKEEPAVAFDANGVPTSRAAILVEKALNACDIKLKGKLASTLTAVSREQDWRAESFGRRIILPDAPRPGW